MSDELRRLYTADEVADWLGASRRVVLDLARAYTRGDAKGLPGIKVLRDWRFTAEDIEAYLAANRSVSGATTTVIEVEPPPVVRRTGLKSTKSRILR